MVDTATGTRTVAWTREQLRLISQWANNAWHDADQNRLLARIDSPQEAAHLADQQFIEQIQEKLRNVS